MYLTPAAVSYLTQIILVMAIVGTLVYTLPRCGIGRMRHAHLLLGFFAATTVFVLLLFFETTSLPAKRLEVVYLQNPVTGLLLLLLLQFAYYFPYLPPGRKGEARLTLGLSALYTLAETGFAVYRFAALRQGLVYFRPEWADYALVVGFLWVPVVFARQAVTTSRQDQPASVGGGLVGLAHLWRPRGQNARAARAFFLVYLLPVGMSMANLLRSYRLIPAGLYHTSLSVVLLLTLFLFAIVYLNSLPERTTFMIKLAGVTLVTVLAVLGLVSWSIMPAYVESYRVASFQRKTLSFTPNDAGGYDIDLAPFQFESEPGDNLHLIDSRNETENAVIDFTFPFYRQTYHQVVVMNDGVVGLGGPADHRTIQYYYGASPAIFPLYLNLIPQAGEGGIFVRREADRLVITWDRVPAFHARQTTYTFQLALYCDGTFTITYHDIPSYLTFRPNSDPEDDVWLVGATPGQPAQPQTPRRPARQIEPADLPAASGPQGVVFDYNLAFRRHLHHLYLPLAGLIIASSLAILLGFPLILYLNLVRPLNALLVGVRRLEAGDYTVKVPVRYADEIGYLTQAFNNLAAQLTDLIRHLETRVAERTEALRQANTRLKAEIAEREQAEMVLRQYALELDARNKELDAFAHTVAHDLKNLVGLIVGYADYLIQDHAALPAADFENALHKIARYGRKQNDVIEELMLLAGVRTQKIVPSPLVMADIVNEALQRLPQLISEHNAHIILPDEADWPVVLGYGPWVEEVWLNYLSNAIKYGGRPPRVRLGADAPAGGKARFWVCDNGPGLGQEDRVRLFTPFTRLDQAQVKGHGLGLSIVRSIVEKLGGEVGVESEPGQGSRFFFTLPLAGPPID